ncbi:hypothetical protein BDY24DRAFT_254176 [Mrakia frigida]|uniref:uncharacterized protein n=1 Tax=Mrakia frigida TaxID=29902 RepID=UPI003FCC119E
MSQANGVGLSTPLLIHRLTHLTLLHSSLSLHQSSLLLSSILHSLLLTEPRESQGRILHAKALLETGAPNSALHLVKQVALTTGDLRLAEVGARACDRLGRNREGLDLMAGAKQRWEENRQRGVVRELEPLHPPTPTPSEQQSSTQCLLASLATKGNEPHKAVDHYLEALKLDPFNWEAFEGLCSIGHFIPSQDVFPPLRPSSSTTSNPPWPGASSSSTYQNLPSANGFNGPLNGRKHLQETKSQPAASGGGFFTPSDAGPAPSGMFAGRKAAAPNLMSSSPPAQAQHSFVLPPNHHAPPPTLTFSHLSGPSSSSTPVSMEDGVGQPPAMKRPRGTGRAAIGVAAGRDPAFEGRNATGRNYSNGVEVNGKGRTPAPNSAASTSTPAGQGGSSDPPAGVRRSSRLSSVTTASVPRPSRVSLLSFFSLSGRSRC